MDLKKLVIWEHVIVNTEKDLERACCLLDRVAARAEGEASKLSDPAMSSENSVMKEAMEFLYEIGHVVSLISDNLDHLGTRLFDCRQKQLTGALREGMCPPKSLSKTITELQGILSCHGDIPVFSRDMKDIALEISVPGPIPDEEEDRFRDQTYLCMG